MRDADLAMVLGVQGLSALVEMQANLLSLLKVRGGFLQQIEQLLSKQGFEGHSPQWAP